MERERLNDAVADLSADIRREMPRLMAQRDDATVRRGLERLNRRIEEVNRRLRDEGPLDLFDVDEVMAQRASRHFSDGS